MWWQDEGYNKSRRRTNTPRGTYRPPILMVKSTGGKSKRGSGLWGGRLVPLALVVLSVAALFWLLILSTQSIGRMLFTQNDEFTIATIVVESDGKQVTPHHLKDWAELSEGMNLFAIDIDRIRKRLESNVPVIESVTIQRQLPDTLLIRVVERQALARLGIAENQIPLAIDAKGYVLGPTARAPTLPVIESYHIAGLRPGSFVDANDMQYALSVLRECDTTPVGQHVRIKSISLADDAHLDIVLEGGTRVLFAGDDIAPRLRKVAALLLESRQRGLFPTLITATGEHNFPAQYR